VALAAGCFRLHAVRHCLDARAGFNSIVSSLFFGDGCNAKGERRVGRSLSRLRAMQVSLSLAVHGGSARAEAMEINRRIRRDRGGPRRTEHRGRRLDGGSRIPAVCLVDRSRAEVPLELSAWQYAKPPRDGTELVTATPMARRRNRGSRYIDHSFDCRCTPLVVGEKSCNRTAPCICGERNRDSPGELSRLGAGPYLTVLAAHGLGGLPFGTQYITQACSDDVGIDGNILLHSDLSG